MDGSKLTPEQDFRESLKDVLTIVEKLAPHCASFTDLTGVVRLALENDGQLNLLITAVKAPAKR